MMTGAEMITAASSLAASAEPLAHGAGGHGEAGPWWVMLIPFVPFLCAAMVGVLAVFAIRSKLPAWLTVAGCLTSFTLVVLAFMGWDGHGVISVTAFRWFDFDWGDTVGTSFMADFGFRFDGLSLLWMLFVSGLSSAIALYASEYMDHDVGVDYCRFFGAFCLFVFSMSCLVMADNMLLLFLGWEGVGLCSYLLIGYFYRRPAAVAAAKKAFIVNRIGDLGLLLGTLFTFTTFGTIEFEPLFAMIQANETGTGAALSESWQVWGIPLLLCGGAFGKSAQLFFYVWLPDAMEGPTPVSALIHAATMVTAGVYLVARMMPLFLADPDLIALTVVAWSGTITALWAATIAMAQYDIKRIMGYSTVSQLGYMFAGLGFLASTGGVFHVFTHAFFKATLFLACGAVMHGFAGQLDMRKLSGLWGVPGFKIVTIAMLIGCLNLSGFPFTAGFFSKDMILAEAFVTPDSVIWGSSAAGWVLLFTAGLTAYYTFRVFFRVFVGPTIYEPGDELHGDDDHGHDDHAHDHGNGHGDAHGSHGGFHPHAPRWAINTVLTVLTIGSLLATGLYFINRDEHGWTGKMVHASSANVGELPWAHHDDHGEDHGLAPVGVNAIQTVAFQHDDHADDHSGDHAHDDEHGHAHGDDHGHGHAALPAGLAAHADAEAGKILGDQDPHKVMYYISGVVGLVSIGIAFFFHFMGRTECSAPKMDAISRAIRPVSTWAERKWLVDEFYGFIIVTPLRMISHIFHWIDKGLVDIGLVDNAGRLPRVVAGAVRPTQNGLLQGYATRMIGGVVVVLLIVVLILY